ncbi:MAG: hypothetical protein ABSA39_10830 [Edaphobacter sp.]
MIRVLASRACLISFVLAAPCLIAQPIRQSKSLTIYTRPLPTGIEPSRRIAALVHQLSDASETKRSSAFNSLAAMGSKVEPQLQWALHREEEASQPNPPNTPQQMDMPRGARAVRYPPSKTMPRTAYHALNVLLKRCKEADHAEATVVTLHFSNAPLTEILREFGRQINADITFTAQSFYKRVEESSLDWFKSAHATVQLNRVPYWNALRTIILSIQVPRNSDYEQFLMVGSNYIDLGGTNSAHSFFLADSGTVMAGSLLLAPSVEAGSPLQFTVRAAADPALTGITGISRLQLNQVSDGHGRSLLREGSHESSSGGLEDKDRDPLIGYEYSPSAGFNAWRQHLELDTPEDSHVLAAARGSFSIGVGPPQQTIGVPLAVFQPSAIIPVSSENEVYLTEDCRELNSPSDDVLPYTKDKRPFCRLRYIPRKQNGDVFTEETDMQLTNEQQTPVTFVVSKELFGEKTVFTQPDQITANMALYRVHAAPGENVSLRLGVRVNYKERARALSQPLSLPMLQTTTRKETAEFDGWRLTVNSVGCNGMLYTIAGQLSAPVDTVPRFGWLYLNVADESRWSIEHSIETSQFRRENNRLVEDFIITTREPGRIPATLLWDTPEMTHWLTVPFEFHNIPIQEVQAKH